MGGGVDGFRVVAEIGWTVVGASAFGSKVGSNVEEENGLIKGVDGVGAGAVVTSVDGPTVVVVVGFIVDDEGGGVQSWKGSPGMGMVVVIGKVVGSSFSSVTVGYVVIRCRVGGEAGDQVEEPSVDGASVEIRAGCDID